MTLKEILAKLPAKPFKLTKTDIKAIAKMVGEMAKR